MPKFTLIRHGESVWNGERRIQGNQDPALSPRGRRQTELLVQHLETHIARPVAAIYTSPLQRAAVFGARLTPGVFNQDTTHGRRGRAVEMLGIDEFVVLLVAQSEKGLVHKRRGLQRLPGRLAGQFAGCQLAQFLVDDGKKIFRPAGPLLHGR